MSKRHVASAEADTLVDGMGTVDAVDEGRRLDLVLGFLTFGRLALVPVVITTFLVAPVITTLALVLFVAADVYDGVAARKRSMDGPRRRALDSIVDRVAIDACLIGACLAGALPIVLLALFLLRDLFCALWCARMMRERHVAIKADWMYRGLNLSVAAWGLAAPFLTASARTWFALVVLAAAAVVASDLYRSIQLVLSGPSSLRDVVVDAGALRRQGRSRWSHATRARLPEASIM